MKRDKDTRHKRKDIKQKRLTNETKVGSLSKSTKVANF